MFAVEIMPSGEANVPVFYEMATLEYEAINTKGPNVQGQTAGHGTTPG